MNTTDKKREELAGWRSLAFNLESRAPFLQQNQSAILRMQQAGPCFRFSVYDMLDRPIRQRRPIPHYSQRDQLSQRLF